MKKITNLEIGVLSYFLSRSFFIAFCFISLLNVAKKDGYISIVMGIFMGIIPLIAYYMLFNYEPSLNIFEKMKKLFGTYLGNLINIILIIITFILSLTLFINLITFACSQYLNKTPNLFIAFSFIICILYTLIKGINSTLRACVIFFLFAIILYFFSTLGLIFQIDLNNFKPVFINNYFKGSFSYLAYNVLPLYVLLLIPKNMIVNNDKTHKFILIFFLIASFSILLMFISIIGIFGIKLSLLYDYPEFQILKYVYFRGISSRLDSILFLPWIFDILIFIIFGLQFCEVGLYQLIKKKKNIIRIILSLILLLLNEKLSTTFIIDNPFISALYHTVFIIIIFILLITISMLLFKDKEISKNSTNN